MSLRAEEVLAKLNEKELADPNGKKLLNQYHSPVQSIIKHFLIEYFRRQVIVASGVRCLYGKRFVFFPIPQFR